jgi:predicted amidohydrolase
MKLILVQPQLGVAPEADNVRVIRAAIESGRIEVEREDIVLLPECVDRRGSAEAYQRDMSGLARALRCHVVGGSYHAPTPTGRINTGLAFDPGGQVIGRYDKLRPYATERDYVQPGSVLGELTIAERRVLVLVCSDFWFADLVQRAAQPPDVILVPALSVSRKPSPRYSRSLWRHLAVARAYEFGVYVGISDWGYPSELPLLCASGVGGFADPTTTRPEALFSPIGTRSVAAHRLDLRALDAFRRDRTSRGFFWTSGQEPGLEPNAIAPG